VRVADVGGEEFDVAPRGFLAEIGDERRDHMRGPQVGHDLGLLDGRGDQDVKEKYPSR
jgi:hypothetical protein